MAGGELMAQYINRVCSPKEAFYEALAERFPYLGMPFEENGSEIEQVIDYVFNQGALLERIVASEASLKTQQASHDPRLEEQRGWDSQSHVWDRCAVHKISHAENSYCWQCLKDEKNEK
jgi:hypothetical protein